MQNGSIRRRIFVVFDLGYTISSPSKKILPKPQQACFNPNPQRQTHYHTPAAPLSLLQILNS
jgi:hypothetical protein